MHIDVVPHSGSSRLTFLAEPQILDVLSDVLGPLDRFVASVL
jgi:hypothetical protein